MAAAAQLAPKRRPAAGDDEQSWWFPLLWAAVGIGICSAMAPLEPSLLEEGLFLHLAQRMIGGERLFVDLAIFTGPFPFELLAVLFRAFGEEIEVARAAVAVFSGLSCAAVFALARRVGLGAWSHLAAAAMASSPVFLFPLHSTYYYSTIAYHLVLMSAFAGLRGTRSDTWAGTAGVLAACVALTKQSVGLAFAPALVLAVFVFGPSERRFRSAGVTALGGLAVAAVTLVYYGAAGGLWPMVESLVFLPLSFEDAFGSVFINLWPPGQFAPELQGQEHFYTPFVYSLLRGVVVKPPSFGMTLTTQVLYALPFIALLATGLRAVRGGLHPAIWFHAVALFALTTNLFPRTDWGHLVYCATPAAVQLILLLPFDVTAARGRGRGLALLSVAGVLAAAALIGTELWGISQSPALGPRISTRTVGSQFRGPALGRVIEYLDRRTEPGEFIFVARSEPLLYFATETRNPTPYVGVIPGMLDEQEKHILAALEDVRFVVMSEIDQPVFTVYRNLLPRVEAYIEQHFELPSEFQARGYGWIVVFERSEDRGATAIDLMAIRDGAKSWIREAADAATPDREAELQSISDELPILATSHNRRPMPIWLGTEGGGIDFDIEVPEDAVFQADVGLAVIRGRRRRHPDRVRFSLSVSTGGEYSLLERTEVMRSRGQANRWKPFEVDLAAYAGQRIQLRLEVTPEKSLKVREIAWWGSPRLISRLAFR